MPNWIEGTLKLRGKSEDLKKFFDNAIKPCFSFNPEYQKREDFIVCHYAEYNEVEIKKDAWIEDARRAFVSQNCYIFWDQTYATVCIPVKQAWEFTAANWQKISQKYNLDVRLYGFEQGMEICQEIEIIGGEITFNHDIKYDDWDWECPMPRMGG